VAKAVSEGLSNPVTSNELVSAGIANVSIDEVLDAGDVLSIGREFADFDSDDLIGFSIPSDHKTTSAGAQVELPDMRQAQTALNIFRGLPPGTLSPESLDVAVLNGTGSPGQAADVAGALQEIGFHIVDVATWDSEDVARTTIHFGPYGEPAAHRVAAHITGGADLVYDESLDPSEIVLVTGADFTTVHDQPAPEGSADEVRTTTSLTTTTPSTEGDDGATTTTSTTLPDTTTTTVIGYSTGEPPDGVACG
jgi:hypothetical protein